MRWGLCLFYLPYLCRSRGRHGARSDRGRKTSWTLLLPCVQALDWPVSVPDSSQDVEVELPAWNRNEVSEEPIDSESGTMKMNGFKHKTMQLQCHHGGTS